MSELKIKKERVLEAAKICGEAKNILRKLFPEVFGPEEIDLTSSCYLESDGDRLLIMCEGEHFVQPIYVIESDKLLQNAFDIKLINGKIIGKTFR